MKGFVYKSAAHISICLFYIVETKSKQKKDKNNIVTSGSKTVNWLWFCWNYKFVVLGVCNIWHQVLFSMLTTSASHTCCCKKVKRGPVCGTDQINHPITQIPVVPIRSRMVCTSAHNNLDLVVCAGGQQSVQSGGWLMRVSVGHIYSVSSALCFICSREDRKT